MLISEVCVASEEAVFQVWIENTRPLIEQELSNLVARTANLRLNRKIEYALLSHGKRLRPLLVVLSAQSVGGNQEEVMPLALAFELLHTSTLVHDDILDKDKFRRDIPAIHHKWSIADAILVGDVMISLAINLAADYGREILKIVSDAGLELCDGEFMDVSMKSIQTSENLYLEKTRKKSASLFKAATQCGAIAGGGSDLEVKCLADFGEHLGMAYQLGDDLADITALEDGIPKDFREGQISLPLIHLYKSSNLVEKEKLFNDIQLLRVKDPAIVRTAIARILHNLEVKGSMNYCRKKKSEYIDQAIMNIQPLSDTVFKIHLSQMAKLLGRV